MVNDEIKRLEKEIELLKRQKSLNKKKAKELERKRQLKREMLRLKYEKPIKAYETVKSESKKTYKTLSQSLSKFIGKQKRSRELRRKRLLKIREKIKNNTATEQERRWYNFYTK